jgi:hypothetical protein
VNFGNYKNVVARSNGIYTGYAGGWRGAEEYLITKVQYIFLFAVCRAIILPMHMAKGVRP